MEETLTIFHID